MQFSALDYLQEARDTAANAAIAPSLQGRFPVSRPFEVCYIATFFTNVARIPLV